MTSASEKRGPSARGSASPVSDELGDTQATVLHHQQHQAVHHVSILRRMWARLKKPSRGTLISFLAVCVSVAGVIIAFRQADTEDRRQVSERLDKIQEKLQASAIEDQVYGIKELERVGSDAPTDLRNLTIDRIAAYVRSKAKRTAKSCGSPDVVSIAHAGLEAIGRLNRDGPASIDLTNTCLRRVSLRSTDLNLTNVNFTGSDLTAARFVDVNLTNTRFDWAILKETEFSAVNLSHAVLCWARTTGVDLRSAILVHTAIQQPMATDLRQRSVDTSQVETCGSR